MADPPPPPRVTPAPAADAPDDLASPLSPGPGAAPRAPPAHAIALRLGAGVHVCASHHKAQGRRAEQQDECLALALSDADPPLAVLAALDGHGGDGGKVARFVRAWLVAELPEALKGPFGSGDQVADALKHVYARVSAALAAAPGDDAAADAAAAAAGGRPDCYMSGTTLVVCVVARGWLVAANVGDSRAVLVARTAARERAAERGEGDVVAVPLTTDHTCTNAAELERVLARGARVERSPSTDGAAPDPESPLRLYKGSMPYPGLVVTRALGDTASSAIGVLAEPEVRVRALDAERDIAVVLASDGVWDGLPGGEADAGADTGSGSVSGASSEAARLVARALGRAAARSATPTPTPAPSAAAGMSAELAAGARAADAAARRVVKAALAGLETKQIDDNVSCVVGVLVRGSGGGNGAA